MIKMADPWENMHTSLNEQYLQQQGVEMHF